MRSTMFIFYGYWSFGTRGNVLYIKIVELKSIGLTSWCSIIWATIFWKLQSAINFFVNLYRSKLQGPIRGQECHEKTHSNLSIDSVLVTRRRDVQEHGCCRVDSNEQNIHRKPVPGVFCVGREDGLHFFFPHFSQSLC